MFRKDIFPLMLLVVAMLGGGGCGNKPAIVYDQPQLQQGGYWEKAWVDPVIIFSDSLYTLFRSDRVDSFFVDKPVDPLDELAPSVVFQIRRESCFTTANILDGQSRVIHPLLARNLGRGFYKITCNTSRLNPELSLSGIFFVRVVYCGFQVVERLTVR
ncbi:MAG: hypothetical protein V3T31_05275 [candidate division Zixibacteria bacterium]